MVAVVGGEVSFLSFETALRSVWHRRPGPDTEWLLLVLPFMVGVLEICEDRKLVSGL